MLLEVNFDVNGVKVIENEEGGTFFSSHFRIDACYTDVSLNVKEKGVIVLVLVLCQVCQALTKVNSNVFRRKVTLDIRMNEVAFLIEACIRDNFSAV